MSIASIRIRPLFLTVGFLAAGMFALSGCGNASRTPAGKKGKSGDNVNVPDATDSAKDRCEALLGSIVDMVQPERLEISASQTLCVETLNNWRGTCGPQLAGAPMPPETSKLISTESFQALNAEQYDVRDINHIRDCLIVRKGGDVVTRNAASDLERSVRLFYYVTRNVVFESPRLKRISKTPYEIIMLGQGNAEDRAWIYAEMLRQYQIDAVILRPAGSGPAPRPAANGAPPDPAANAEKTETKSAEPTAPADAAPPGPAEKPWLVGVLIDKQVYLYDMRLGWPVPAASDDGSEAFVRRPATLKDVLENDALLRKLDLSDDRPYPLKSDDLKTLKVEVITDSRYWSPRMRAINSIYPPYEGRTVVLYDPVYGSEGERGLIARVLDSGAGWTAEQITVWSFPEDAYQAVATRSKEAANQMRLQWLAFDATRQLSFDAAKMEPVATEPTHLQLKTRTSHVTGDLADSIKSYLTVQISEYPDSLPLPRDVYDALLADARTKGIPQQRVPRAFRVPEDIWYMHGRAAQDATFWIALAQYEQGDFKSSIDTCLNFLRKYQDKGLWSAAAASLIAMSQAEQRSYALSVQSMNQAAKVLPEDHPQRYGWELLSARWRAAREREEQSQQKPSEKPASKSEEKTDAKTDEKADLKPDESSDSKSNP